MGGRLRPDLAIAQNGGWVCQSVHGIGEARDAVGTIGFVVEQGIVAKLARRFT